MPWSEASSRTYQTVSAPAVPLYSGRRTVSLSRSTRIALSSVKWSRGSSPLVRPSDERWARLADLGPADAWVPIDIAATATSAKRGASTRHFDNAFIGGSFLEQGWREREGRRRSCAGVSPPT